MSIRNRAVTGALNSRGISRRDTLRLAGAGLFAPALMGLGSRAEAQAKSLRLLTEDTDDPEIAWYKKVNALFTAKHGTTVNYDAIGMSGLFEKLTSAISANDPPDMVAGSGLSRVATLAKLGVLQPVGDIVDAVGRADFFPGAVDQFTWDGQVLAVPVQGLAFLYWYRTDLAKQANVKIPTNWDELLAYAKALTRDGKYGICLPGGINTATARQVLMFIRQGGGNIVDEKGAVALDQPKNRQSLAFMKELYQYSPPGTPNYGFGDLLTNYQSGVAASTYYSGRMLQRVTARAPDIAPFLGGIRAPTATKPFSYTEPRGAYVLAGARNRQAAKDWMLEYQFEPGSHIDWLLTAPGNNLPIRKSIAEDSRYKDFPLLKQRADILQVLLAESNNPGNFYKESFDHKPNPVGGSLDTGPILPTMLQRYLINNESAEAVLAWGQKQIVQLMKDG